jgi:hypothetical protein
MSIHAHPFLAILWALSISYYVQLFASVHREGSHRWFLAYIGSYIIENVALLSCSALRAGHAYHSIYWAAYPISVTLVTVCAYHSFANIFGPYRCMPRRFFHEFGASLLLLSISVAALYTRFPSMRSGSDGGLFTLLRSTETWLCGAFMLISAFSDRYGIPWDTRAFGIGLGFLSRTSLGIFTAAIYAHSPSFSTNSPRLLAVFYATHFAVDAISCTIWVAWFHKKTVPLMSSDSSMLHELSAASVFLKKISGPSSVSSRKSPIDRVA